MKLKEGKHLITIETSLLQMAIKQTIKTMYDETEV